MFIILQLLVQSLTVAQSVNFSSGMLTYSLPSYQVGAPSQLLTFIFNLNITLPQQIYIDFIFPQQNSNQLTYRCAISQPNTMCFYQSGMYELRWMNPLQQFQVTFGYFNNPTSNYSDPIQIICKNALNTNTLFIFNFTIQYTLLSLDTFTFKLNNPKTFTETDLLVSWNQSYPLNSGAYLRLTFPQFNPGSSMPNYGPQENNTIQTVGGFTSSYSYSYSQGQLIISDQYVQGQYCFKINKFNGMYSVKNQRIIQIAIMDQPNSYISVGQAVIIADNFYDQMPVKIQSSSSYIRDMVNVTLALKPMMMLPTSSILIAFTNKMVFDFQTSYVQIGGQSVHFTVSINQISNSTSILINQPLAQIIENQELSVQILNIINPAYADLQEIFKISIQDQNNNTSQQGQVMYKSVVQNVKNFSIQPSTNILNSPVNYTVSIYPRFQLIEAYISLTIPSELQVTGGLGIYNPQNFYKNFSARLVNLTITLQNITQLTDDWLQFVIIGLVNPQDKIYISPFYLQIGDLNGIMTQDNLFINTKLLPFTLISQLNYDFKCTTSSIQNISLVLINDLQWTDLMVLKIFIPTQLVMVNTECIVENFDCEIVNQTVSIQRNSSLNVNNVTVILNQIQMPPSLAKSDPFLIELWNNLLIASGQSDSIQLTSTSEAKLTVSASTYQLLQDASWTLQLYLQNISINEGDKISITSPLNGEDVECYLIVPTSVNLNCQFNNQLNLLQMVLNQTIHNSMSLQIIGLYNPGSVQGQRNWSLIITDSLNYQKATAISQSSQWTLTPISRPTLSLNDTRLGLETNLTISLESQIYLPTGSQIYIKFLTQSFETFNIKYVSIDGNQTSTQSGSDGLYIKLRVPLQQGIHQIILAPVSLRNGYRLQSQQILAFKYQITFIRDGNPVQSGTYMSQIQFTCAMNCTSCSQSYHQCNSCSENYFIYPNQTCLQGCDKGFVLSGDQCKKCQTDNRSCAVCSSVDQRLCSQCQKGYILDQGSCIKQVASSSVTQTPQREITNMYFILTGVVMFILDLCVIRRCIHKQTRLITLSYGLLVIVQHVMEMTVIVDFFLQQKTEYAFASLSLLVIHLLSQVYCITQISMTLKTDGDYYNLKRSSGIVQFIHFVSNLFCYRTLLLLFSRCGKAQYWDGQFHYKIQVMEYLTVLLKISLIYSIGFSALIITYVYFTLELELYFYELAAFSLLMVLLDGYHIYWIQKERQITIRKRDVSKLIISVVEDPRPSPSQIVPHSSVKL